VNKIREPAKLSAPTRCLISQETAAGFAHASAKSLQARDDNFLAPASTANKFVPAPIDTRVADDRESAEFEFAFSHRFTVDKGFPAGNCEPQASIAGEQSETRRREKAKGRGQQDAPAAASGMASRAGAIPRAVVDH